ncbi:wobble nucleotide-excising tRNase [Nitrosomonas nitrosa]|uniref:AAA family ATPase n=1 Tax=Nitrosomonas nitrosa TaxID=52442 RepID=UPI000D30F597|nr:AAA family ATPase [Nitrosomonas nitrosa]PTQ90920.1 wobble nucleotide-excising tRNase [Nitrosomonas nitrosa]
MSGEIKKIDTIRNMAVFQDFRWASSVRDEGNNVAEFKKINILYGRNYSGKTTLSRILRAMETGGLSDKFENPSFVVTFVDGTQTTQSTPTAHGKKIRVFNEDFVRDNLRFITNPDDSIEPFAILGDDNNKIEREIEALESELGSKGGGKESGLYAQQITAKTQFNNASQEYKTANDALEKQLGNKANDKNIGIRYKPERFGDQNYNIQKLRADIERVLDANYQLPTDEQLTQCEKLISEKTLQPIPPFHAPSLNVSILADETETLVTKKISESDKIEELVKDAILNRWVNDGRTHHKDKRVNCAFCGNFITEERWVKLERHFDEESEKFEKDIDALIAGIEAEKSAVAAALSLDKARFYSKFHGRIDELDKMLKDAVGKYAKSLEALTVQLKARKDDILNPKTFEKPDAASGGLVAAWNLYDEIRSESDTFSNSLSAEQTKAKEALRLKEVSDYLVTIRYQEQLSSIEGVKSKFDEAKREKDRIEEDIRQKEELITSKKRELNDEEKGAKKVNEYLNNFFGHQFLSLEAKKDEIAGEESKRIRFEVIRDGKKAYYLSEGECSLLAFCYFLAKLDDIDTRDSKPIIWIDDPISSLDGNHIFFVYSLLNAEIVSSERFEQLFVSTHNLDFLKYLKRLNGKYLGDDRKEKDYQKGYFVVIRQDKTSTIGIMPKYLKEYVTEFNYLFHQIHKCAAINTVDDNNFTTFYNFANNARKFFEIYLYYKYPDQGMTSKTLHLFFGEEKIPAVLTDRINNEYSHLCGVFERGSTPVEVPEMQTAARQIIERLKEDKDQYSALLKSIGSNEDSLEGMGAKIEGAQ